MNLEVKNNILPYLGLILFLCVIGSSIPVESEYNSWVLESYYKLRHLFTILIYLSLNEIKHYFMEFSIIFLFNTVDFSPDPPGWFAFINYCLSFPVSFILNNYLFIYDSSQIGNSSPHLSKTPLGNFLYLGDFTWPPIADWLLSLLVCLLLLFWFFIRLGYCYEFWNMFFFFHFYVLLNSIIKLK